MWHWVTELYFVFFNFMLCVGCSVFVLCIISIIFIFSKKYGFSLVKQI